jgi:hypothetical protein
MNKETNETVRKKYGYRKRGADRRAAVTATIELVGSLTREQIQELHFEKLTKKCQLVLKNMTDNKKLQRGRCDISDQYCYWIGKKPYRIDHNILLNWIYVAARSQGIEVKAWIAPYIQPEVEPDAFTILCYDGKFVVLFIEFQRSINNSKFDKVQKYIAHFLAMEWAKKDWVKPINGEIAYPMVLVVTDGKTDHIKEVIDRENKFEYEGEEVSLRFKVATLEEVRTDLRMVIE